MTNHKGLYVKKLNNQKIEEVIICDPSGKLIALTPEKYIDHNLAPKIDELPDEREYKSQQKSEISPIIIALANWANGNLASPEETYRMQQFGFIYPDSQGILRITASGKQALKDNGLI
jgi:hypothetical protein